MTNENKTTVEPTESINQVDVDIASDTTAEKQEDTRRYATFNARILAAMLDTLISLLPFTLLGLLVQFSTPQVPDPILMKLSSGGTLTPAEFGVLKQQAWFAFGNLFSQFIVITAIVTALWVKFGATPGKMILGIMVVDSKTNQKPGIWQSLIRAFGYIISTVPLMIGLFWMNFDKKKQCWHDKMAGTVVIYTENSIYQKAAAKYARLLSGRQK